MLAFAKLGKSLAEFESSPLINGRNFISEGTKSKVNLTGTSPIV